jgi:hypothetical protein
MKNFLISSTTLLAAVSLMAADKDDVKSAAQKLGGADNYSWTTTVEIANSQFTPGPSHGKTQKDGLVWLDMTFQDNTTEAYAKGAKGAVKGEDGWEALDLSPNAPRGGGGGGFSPSRMMGMRLRNFKAPATQMEDLVDKTKDLAKSGDAYTGDLTEEGAKSLMTFGRRAGGGGGQGQAPEISKAKGTVKFWIKDGVITKYQTKATGTRKNQDGDDMDIDITSTVEIKDVGTTKLTVPDEAQKKMT